MSRDVCVLHPEQIRQMNGWAITNVDDPDTRAGAGRVEVNIDRSQVMDPDQLHYWIAPSDYHGNKVTSYGGRLEYTLRYDGAGAATSGPDVRIEGGGNTLIHYALNLPNEGEELRMRVDLLEV